MFVARSKTVGESNSSRPSVFSSNQGIDNPNHHDRGLDDSEITLECLLQTLLGLLQHGLADVCADLLETMLDRQSLMHMPLSCSDAPEIRQKLLEAGALLIHGPSPRATIMPHPPEDVENPTSEDEDLAKDATASNATLQAFKSEVLRNPCLPPVSESGGQLRRLFLLLEEPEQSLLGRITTAVLTLAIFISVVSFVLESMPSFRTRPRACAERLAAGLPLTVEACEPQPDENFQTVETVCLSFFTAEYIFRILSVHAGSSTLREAVCCTLRYALQPLMLVDFLAILPSYLRLGLKNSSGSQLGIMRILRMLRILRLFKLAKHSQGLRTFAEVLRLSGRPLLILVFFNVIVMLVFGSLIHFAEGQRYSVASEFLEKHPTGVFVRAGPLNGLQPTPFRSIPYSIWWVCITMTTVGYGDYAPTTSLGKLVGVVCFYIGVLFLALPVNILGSNFELVYGQYLNGRREPDPPDKRLRRNSSAVMRRASSSFSSANRPWLPQCHGFRKRVFFLFEHPTCCRFGKAISTAVMFTIIIGTVSFIMESMPEFRNTPEECKVPLTVNNCEPRPWPIFMTLEKVAIAIFTVDYVCRMSSVHAVSPAECNLNSKYANSAVCRTWLYFWQWMNLIDVLAILPFYLELLGLGPSSGGSSVLRVFRLVRVFRMLKMPKVSGAVTMFANVVADSLPALFTLFFMTLMGCVFFASLATFAEGSTYSVEHFKDDYPEGVYIRPTADGYDVEPSPFLSVAHAFWWFFVTANTVGYGDLYPTTTLGRIIGVTTSYVGILLIALPITIVGGNFSNHFDEWVRSMDLESSANQQLSGTSQFSEHKAETRSNRLPALPADSEAVEAPKNTPDTSPCKSVLTNSCTLFSGGANLAKEITWTASNGNGDAQNGCQKI
mmetsp:Transcript_38795/g.76903  ORF Transcript_38795/g.76903 Transcript_38795/m.76903 type:complete len:893 (-) Transcript_38795:109-2787(-)